MANSHPHMKNKKMIGYSQILFSLLNYWQQNEKKMYACNIITHKVICSMFGMKGLGEVCHEQNHAKMTKIPVCACGTLDTTLYKCSMAV